MLCINAKNDILFKVLPNMCLKTMTAKNEGEEVIGSFLEETGKKAKRFELSSLSIDRPILLTHSV